MKVLVVAEEGTESVDFLIINLINGDYDTTGLNADRCGRANGERMAREVGLVTGVYPRS